MKDLEQCRIRDFDDIYYGTKDSQGYEDAVVAIRFVLFGDDSCLSEIPSGDKYSFISSNNNARKKAMLLQKDDLGHILVKYCMASFGLRGLRFSVDDKDFKSYYDNIKDLDITAYEMIEAVSYAATIDVMLAYDFLFKNKKILGDVVEYMIQERYISELGKELDNFSGLIDNKNIGEEFKFSYFEVYNNLDKLFAEIKENNPDYIR